MMTRRMFCAQAGWLLPATRGAAATGGRFLRLWWFEHGIEHGNPVSNRRFRVNAPEAVLHPSFGKRSETKSSGMLQILMEEDLFLLDGAELYLELWGGHPGTENKRVTPNGRTTYAIPEVGTAARHCTHQCPLISLELTDLVNGYNAFQFACDQGSSFWGHFIVDNACLRAILKPDHPDLVKAGLAGFAASLSALPAGPETILISLEGDPRALEAVSRVDFQAFYQGYNENGSLQAADWHGFTKDRKPVAFLGTAAQAPFRVSWDTSMLPAQEGIAVRAFVHFKNLPNLVYATAPLEGLRVPPRKGTVVKLYPARDLPSPFLSRVNRKARCAIDLDIEPERIHRAVFHIVTWDGGRGNVKDYFTLNGHPLAVAGEGRHDVIYSALPLDPMLLRKGRNEIVLVSDTEHHGIEVLLPGPAIMVRVGN